MMVVMAPVMVVMMMVVAAHMRDKVVMVMMPADMVVMMVMPSVRHLDRFALSRNRCGRKRRRLAGLNIDAKAKAHAEHRQQNEFSQHASSRRARCAEPVN